MSTFASSAAPLHLGALATRVFAAIFRRRSADMSGPAVFMSQRAKRAEPLQSVQAQASPGAMKRRHTMLLIEAEILRAEVKEARRQHRAVSSTKADLRAVVTELLTIG